MFKKEDRTNAAEFSVSVCDTQFTPQTKKNYEQKQNAWVAYIEFNYKFITSAFQSIRKRAITI